MEQRFLIAIGLVALTIVVGVWLHRLDRPLNSFVFTLHKLAAVGGVIMTTAVFVRTGQMDYSSASLVFAVLAWAMVIVLFLSGAMLSLDKFSRDIMLRVHDASTAVFVISSSITIYLLMK